MSKAGLCAECGANVYLNDDGSCSKGHPASSISGVYEVADVTPPSAAPAAVAPAAPPAKKKNTALIVVLSILGVLLLCCVLAFVGSIVAGVGIPMFSAASEDAQQRQCWANQRTIEGAIEQWLASEPDGERAGAAGSAWESVVVPDYIKQAPVCPDGGTYSYADVNGGELDCSVHGHY